MTAATPRSRAAAGIAPESSRDKWVASRHESEYPVGTDSARSYSEYERATRRGGQSNPGRPLSRGDPVPAGILVPHRRLAERLTSVRPESTAARDPDKSHAM